MLTILQSESDLEAAEQQQQLSENVAALLESNQSLTLRLMKLEDTLDVRTVRNHNGGHSAPSRQQQPSGPRTGKGSTYNDVSQLSSSLDGIAIPAFEFQDELQASRVYRRAQRESMDFSFRSSIAHTNAWSVFSGLSLSDISIMSAIALPLCLEDIGNSQHYDKVEYQTDSINTKAVVIDEQTLYEKCLKVELCLMQIPELAELLMTIKDQNPFGDILTVLIEVFRSGWPLWNLVQLVDDKRCDLELGEDLSPGQLTRVFVEHFIRVYEHDGFSDPSFPPDKCFSCSDLFDDNTTAHIEVVRVVSRLLDLLASHRKIVPIDLTSLRSERAQQLETFSRIDIMMEEFLIDERYYSAELENLLRVTGPITGYPMISLKMREHIVSLIDIQRRLLLKVEAAARNSLSTEHILVDRQDAVSWLHMVSESAQFVRNEMELRDSIKYILIGKNLSRESIRRAGASVLVLLPLPFQRLQGYLKFLQDLQEQEDRKNQECDSVSRSYVSLCIDFFQKTLQNINAIKNNELKFAEAKLNVECPDFKRLRVEERGKLRLFDIVNIHFVFVGNAYHAYFFEKLILSCEEVSPSRRLISRRAKTEREMQITRKIYINNVTRTMQSFDTDSCKLYIWWREDNELGSLSMRFEKESTMDTWAGELDALRNGKRE